MQKIGTTDIPVSVIAKNIPVLIEIVSRRGVGEGKPLTMTILGEEKQIVKECSGNE